MFSLDPLTLDLMKLEACPVGHEFHIWTPSVVKHETETTDLGPVEGLSLIFHSWSRYTTINFARSYSWYIIELQIHL